MAENGGLFLSEEQLNVINRSIVENINKCIPEIIERVTPLIMEKIDTHLKQFWSNDKRNTELSFPSIKQEAEHFIYSNSKLWSDLLQKRKDFVYKFTRCERLLDLYGECLQEEPMYIPRKFSNDKTYVTSQEELNVVRRNDLNNLQSECEILKLRKYNLLENIANQDKILEEKLREGKINQQVKKEILFYWDCDMTKDIENVNKKWETKILGMTKAYEKDKRFLETEKVRRIPFNQTSPPPDTAFNDTNENVESTSNKTSHSRE